MSNNPRILFEHPAGVRVSFEYGRAYAEQDLEGQWKEIPLHDLEAIIAEWVRTEATPEP